jgi:tight adherence protein B
MTGASWTPLMVAVAVSVWPGRPARTDRRATRPVVRSVRRGPGGGETARGDGALPVATTPRWRGRSPAAGPEGELVSVLEGLTATLRAGLTPARALRHLAVSQRAADQQAGRGVDGPSSWAGELLARLAAEAAAGSPLEPVWRREAMVRGSPALLAVAEGWAMTERHGAPLVDVLDTVARALRDGARTQAAVEVAMAGPRATATLLGVLPLGGLVLGELVGVHPVAVLLVTSAGRGVGCAGLACTVAGRVWMRRLVTGVTRAGGR